MRRTICALALVAVSAAALGVNTPNVSTASARSSAPGRPIRWLAAGDSYSSGEGLSDVSEQSCQRADRSGVHTSGAWPEIALETLGDDLRLEPGVGSTGGFDFVACTGAVSEDLLNNVSANGKKEWDPRTNGRFDLVTFSFGGNNIGFDDILKNCLGLTVPSALATVVSWGALGGCPSEGDIRNKIDGLMSGGNDTNGVRLPPLPDFYQRIASDVVNPGGNVVVLGYPEFVEDPRLWPFANTEMDFCQGIRYEDALMLRGVAGYLNQTIGQAVRDANNNPYGVHFTFVDVNTQDPTYKDDQNPTDPPPFFEPTTGDRHNLCSAKPWLNGFATGFQTGTVRIERSFHPTQTGHDNEGKLVAHAIRALDWSKLAAPQPASWTPVWRPLEGTTWTPATGANSGTISAPSIWWGGIVSDATPGCNHRLEGDARVVKYLEPGGLESGFGFAVRAVVDGSNVSDGQGIQYEPALGRVRDVDYKDFNAAPNRPLTTDTNWHHLAIEVRGDTYKSELDGTVVFEGRTTALCAGLAWIRVWQAEVEVRKLSATILPDATAGEFQDGDFETPDIGDTCFTTIHAGGTIGPWTVGVGSVDHQGSGPSFAPPNQTIDLSGLDAGSIWQTFATNPGTKYRVKLKAASNSVGPPSVKTFAVGVNATNAPTINYLTSKKGGSWCETGDANSSYDEYSYVFTATFTTTTLTISSLNPGRFGPVIDAVTVAPAGPTDVTSGPAGTMPTITSVSAITPNNVQEIVIEGTGFGTLDRVDGVLPCISLFDLTGKWEAGHVDVQGQGVQSFSACKATPGAVPDQVTIGITEWTDTRIRIFGFLGDYGNLSEAWTLKEGDTVRVRVANAQTGSGPAEASVVVTKFR